MVEKELLDNVISEDGMILGFIAIPSYRLLPEWFRKELLRIIAAVWLEMKIDNIAPQHVPINCVFSKEEILTSISSQEDTFMGCTCRIIYYPLEKLLSYQDTYSLDATFAEELCHAIWDISDEVVVKLKALLIVRYIYPNLSFFDLFEFLQPLPVSELLQQAEQILSHHRSSFSFRLPELSDLW